MSPCLHLPPVGSTQPAAAPHVPQQHLPHFALPHVPPLQRETKGVNRRLRLLHSHRNNKHGSVPMSLSKSGIWGVRALITNFDLTACSFQSLWLMAPICAKLHPSCNSLLPETSHRPPDVSACCPARIRRVLDLPAPLLPKKPKHSPHLIPRLRLSTATFGGRVAYTCRGADALASIDQHWNWKSHKRFRC